MNIKHNEFITSMPDDWEDRTMITMVAPFAPGDQFAANVVVTKHTITPRQSIEDFVAEQLEIMKSSVPNFQLLDVRKTSLRGFPASQQFHRFRTESSAMQQVQTFVLCGAVIFSITGTAPLDEFDRHIVAFRQIVDNFQFEKDTF
jgi:hypothetical protein